MESVLRVFNVGSVSPRTMLDIWIGARSRPEPSRFAKYLRSQNDPCRIDLIRAIFNGADPTPRKCSQNYPNILGSTIPEKVGNERNQDQSDGGC